MSNRAAIHRVGTAAGKLAAGQRAAGQRAGTVSVATGKVSGNGAWARQRTLNTAVQCRGVGLHSGVPVTMTLRPAAADTGIVFRRIDLPEDQDRDIPARWDNVANTQHCTLIRNAAGATVSTVEHVMAALAGMGVDNALIELDAGEPPIMDGSAAPFVFLVECAGVVEQDAPRRVLKIKKAVTVGDARKSATLVPGDGFAVSCEIEFDNDVVARQKGFFRIDGASFKSDIARARTFGFLHEVDYLRQVGLAQGGSLDNAVVVSADGVMNPDGLRYGDEFVRHKVLDCVGDLYLAGALVQGHFHGFRSGHAMNNQLLRAVFADPANYEWVLMPAADQVEAQNQAPAGAEPQRVGTRVPDYAVDGLAATA